MNLSEKSSKSREEFVEEMRSNLEESQSRIEVLKAKAEELTGDAKETYQEQLASLKKKRDVAAERMHAAADSADDAWIHVRDGMADAWDDLRSALQKLAGRR